MMSAKSAPPLALLGIEPLRMVCELALTSLHQFDEPAGDGHPVVVLPGLAAGPLSTAVLRNHLTHQGFDAYDWGQGLNTGPRGDLHEWLEPLAQEIQRVANDTDEQVSLVGWSLGGIFSREIAKLIPGAIRRVITLGSPFGANPNATHAKRVFELLNGSKVSKYAHLLEKLRAAPPVALTSVYSRTDGVVGWEGCIQRGEGQYENIEVNAASHLGMGFNTEVLDLVTRTLALPAGELLTRTY